MKTYAPYRSSNAFSLDGNADPQPDPKSEIENRARDRQRAQRDDTLAGLEQLDSEYPDDGADDDQYMSGLLSESDPRARRKMMIADMDRAEKRGKEKASAQRDADEKLFAEHAAKDPALVVVRKLFEALAAAEDKFPVLARLAKHPTRGVRELRDIACCVGPDMDPHDALALAEETHREHLRDHGVDVDLHVNGGR